MQIYAGFARKLIRYIFANGRATEMGHTVYRFTHKKLKLSFKSKFYSKLCYEYFLNEWYIQTNKNYCTETKLVKNEFDLDF